MQGQTNGLRGKYHKPQERNEGGRKTIKKRIKKKERKEGNTERREEVKNEERR